MSFKKIVFSVIKFSHRQLFYKKNITLFTFLPYLGLGTFFPPSWGLKISLLQKTVYLPNWFCKIYCKCNSKSTVNSILRNVTYKRRIQLFDPR